MTLATETRNAAFYAHRDSGALSKQERTIMLVFHRVGPPRDWTLAELADVTGIPVHTVSARVNALKNAGFLEESTPRRHAYSAKTVTPLRLRRVQTELFA